MKNVNVSLAINISFLLKSYLMILCQALSQSKCTTSINYPQCFHHCQRSFRTLHSTSLLQTCSMMTPLIILMTRMMRRMH